MSLNLTIGGEDFTGQMKTDSPEINEREDGKANTLNLEINRNDGEKKPRENEEIVLKHGDRFLFGGYITNINPAEFTKGDRWTDEVEAISYVYIPTNKRVARAFKDWKAGDIIKELLRENVDTDYGINDDNVEDGPEITQISFNHTSLKQALNKIAKKTGYKWWIDYEKKVYFAPDRTDEASHEFTDDLDNQSRVEVETESTQIKNVITVVGAAGTTNAEESEGTITETFTGDGKKRKFSLKANPKTVVSAKFNGEEKPFDYDPINDESGNFFMFHFQDGTVRVTDDEEDGSEDPPTEEDEIEVEYRYPIPVTVKYIDTESVKALKALEGGDGRHEDTIIDRQIRTSAEGRDRGKREADDFGNPRVIIRIDTNSDLLSGESEDEEFHVGQIVKAKLPSWGINNLTEYRIREVNIKPIETTTGILYTYNISLGGRLLGTREFLEELAGEEEIEIEDVEEVERIINMADRSTIQEQHDENLITPPWKWEIDPNDTHPVKAKWGLAEWG